MEFDIYDMCPDDNTIKVVLDETLKEKILEISLNIKKKKLAKDMGITYGTLWRWLNRRKSIPLKFFKVLKEKYNIDFSNHMDYFESYWDMKKIRLPKELNTSLAKIIGAHLADGHLKSRNSERNNRNCTRYELILREEYQRTVESFCGWFNDCFEYGINPKERKNHHEVYVSNRVIFEFFSKILKMPVGPKTEIFVVPGYIKNSNKNIKIAFLRGVFMFDGAVARNNGYISLMLKNKRFIEEAFSLLLELGFDPHICKTPDKFGRCRISMRVRDLKRSLILFEKNTEKWCRLKNNLAKRSLKRKL